MIHAQTDGKPGPVLGFTQVNDGTSANVIVEIEVSQATETLYAMLHTDAGQAGVYEFPGDDVPVKVNDQVVVSPFQILEGEMQASASMSITINRRHTQFGVENSEIWGAGETRPPFLGTPPIQSRFSVERC